MRLFSVILAALSRLLGRTEPPSPATKPTPLPQPTPTPAPKPVVGAPWLALARQEDGTREIGGSRHNPKILAYFKDAGHPEITDDETAWCAAFVGAMLERSGYPGSKSLAARSYLNWGTALKEPKEGCIAVFTRGNSSWQGHVGFYVGEDRESIFVLGGNQSNAVNVTRIPRSTLLGYRWPPSMATSRTAKAQVYGLLGLGVQGTAMLAPDLLQLSGELKALGDMFKWFYIAGAALSIYAICLTLYARYDDLRTKGR